jgi:hypothetical protein
MFEFVHTAKMFGTLHLLGHIPRIGLHIYGVESAT